MAGSRRKKDSTYNAPVARLESIASLIWIGVEKPGRGHLCWDCFEKERPAEASDCCDHGTEVAHYKIDDQRSLSFKLSKRCRQHLSIDQWAHKEGWLIVRHAEGSKTCQKCIRDSSEFLRQYYESLASIIYGGCINLPKWLEDSIRDSLGAEAKRYISEVLLTLAFNNLANFFESKDVDTKAISSFGTLLRERLDGLSPPADLEYLDHATHHLATASLQNLRAVADASESVTKRNPGPMRSSFERELLVRLGGVFHHYSVKPSGSDENQPFTQLAARIILFVCAPTIEPDDTDVSRKAESVAKLYQKIQREYKGPSDLTKVGCSVCGRTSINNPVDDETKECRECSLRLLR